MNEESLRSNVVWKVWNFKLVKNTNINEQRKQYMSLSRFERGHKCIEGVAAAEVEDGKHRDDEANASLVAEHRELLNENQQPRQL